MGINAFSGSTPLNVFCSLYIIHSVNTRVIQKLHRMTLKQMNAEKTLPVFSISNYSKLAYITIGLLLPTIVCERFQVLRSADDVKMDRREVRALNR